MAEENMAQEISIMAFPWLEELNLSFNCVEQ